MKAITMRGLIFIGSLCIATILTTTAFGQQAVPKFPRDASSWINSGPITEETLKGKAAVLYFYEET